jgi:hypothetical protein
MRRRVTTMVAKLLKTTIFMHILCVSLYVEALQLSSRPLINVPRFETLYYGGILLHTFCGASVFFVNGKVSESIRVFVLCHALFLFANGWSYLSMLKALECCDQDQFQFQLKSQSQTTGNWSCRIIEDLPKICNVKEEVAFMLTIFEIPWRLSCLYMFILTGAWFYVLQRLPRKRFKF